MRQFFAKWFSSAKKPSAARRRVRLELESLESRLVPAQVVNAHTLTYQDVDGDNVSVVFSKDFLTPSNYTNYFKFSSAGLTGGAQRLIELDLRTLSQVFAGLDITVTAQQDPTLGGDNLVNLGAIDARGLDLGNVTVQGNLLGIAAGHNTADTGLADLTLQNLGWWQNGSLSDYNYYLDNANSGGLVTDLNYAGIAVTGKLGSVTINGDLNHANINANGIGDVIIHGNITAAQGSLGDSRDTTEGIIKSVGNITSIQIDGNVSASSTAPGSTGMIIATGSITTINIGGSLNGGLGLNSGSISAASLLTVHVGGNVQGGVGQASGAITAQGFIGEVDVDGSLLGGAGIQSGEIAALTYGSGYLGVVKIGHDVKGGSGPGSGQIASAGVLGIHTIAIGGDLAGGSRYPGSAPASQSGEILSSGKLDSVTVGGNVVGGDGVDAGAIVVMGRLSQVTIQGSLLGGAAAYATGSGSIRGGDIGTVIIHGNVQGGSAPKSGRIASNDNIGSLQIGGSLIAGHGSMSGWVQARWNIGALRITGNVQGQTDNLVIISSFSGFPASLFVGGKANNDLLAMCNTFIPNWQAYFATDAVFTLLLPLAPLEVIPNY